MMGVSKQATLDKGIVMRTVSYSMKNEDCAVDTRCDSLTCFSDVLSQYHPTYNKLGRS